MEKNTEAFIAILPALDLGCPDWCTNHVSEVDEPGWADHVQHVLVGSPAVRTRAGADGMKVEVVQAGNFRPERNVTEIQRARAYLTTSVALGEGPCSADECRLIAAHLLAASHKMDLVDAGAGSNVTMGSDETTAHDR